MYNPDNQYRCTIIRGKAQKELDNLLPFYANVVGKLSPCTKKEFNHKFNEELSILLFESTFANLNESNQKTVRNHITEIAGKLFGLYYECDGFVEMSESCKFLIRYGDQPAFFKNLCLNFQFPNATQKVQTIKHRIDHRIHLKPFYFVVSLLDYAMGKGVSLTKQDIAYYVLNALDVLQGEVTVVEVFNAIVHDRTNHVVKPHLHGSKEMQHISEQLNLLELSNIIRQQGDVLILNNKERVVIDVFKRELNEPYFDIYSYQVSDGFDPRMYSDWAKYYGSLKHGYDLLKTTDVLLSTDIELQKEQKDSKKHSTVEIGNRGELYVYELEKVRVRNYKERFVNKVLLLGKIRGIGYDISSIEAEGEDPEFARYIEVKTTIRVTKPDINDIWRDTITLTAKEWTAAKQYKEFYNIYRVYFTPNRTLVYRINDPYTMYSNKELDVYPTTYQMEINQKHIKEAF